MRVLILFASLMLSLNAHAFDLQQLSDQLAKPSVIHGSFIQEKHLRALPQPLVSKGTFVLAKNHGLLWLLKTPLQQDYRITAKGIAPGKIAVIPPWSQDGEVRFDAAGRAAFRKLHRLEGKFVVMHSGNHTPVHPLDTLMQAADKLRGEPDVVFCFVGGGSEFQRIKKWAEEQGKAESGKRKAEIICLPYQPLDQLSTSLSAADAHVVVVGDAMLGLVHPCKIYNMLTVVAPVIYIGPETSHVTEILENLQPQHPWIGVRHGAADELARQIQQLRRTTTGQERRSLAEVTERYSAATLLPRLVAVLEQNAAKPAN